MKINSFFEDIEQSIIFELLKAKKNIKIAMCYFTNQDLIKLLANKSFAGVDVEIILDQNSTLNKEIFVFAKEIGCNIFLSKSSYTMHNKFCIIDDNTLITGSYNWTKNAKRNSENIIIMKDDNTGNIENYSYVFESLKGGACLDILEAKSSKQNPLLTPLISSRLKKKESAPSVSVWSLKENPMLERTINYSWIPFRNKVFTVNDFPGENKKEQLLLDNEKWFGFLNYNDFSIRVDCTMCKEELITRWFDTHLISKYKCPNCKTNFNEK